MHSYKYHGKGTEEESERHGLVNLISVVSKIFWKLIRNEIIKHLGESIVSLFFRRRKRRRRKEEGTLSPWLQEEEWLEDFV